MKEVKIIKRYQNRKLYDTHQSCYVTLEEISQMIKNGDDLAVIDNKSKNDITKQTLTQLLYESERKNQAPVPVGLLKEIISKGNGSFSGYIRKHMGDEVNRFEDTVKVTDDVAVQPQQSVAQENTITQ